MLPLLVIACTGAPEVHPYETPEGRACQAVREAMQESVTRLFERRGTPLPARWPERGEFMGRCLDLGLTVEQLACLEPLRAQGDPEGCGPQLTESKRAVDGFVRWYNLELKAGLADRRSGAQASPEPSALAGGAE